MRLSFPHGQEAPGSPPAVLDGGQQLQCPLGTWDCPQHCIPILLLSPFSSTRSSRKRSFVEVIGAGKVVPGEKRPSQFRVLLVPWLWSRLEPLTPLF